MIAMRELDSSDIIEIAVVTAGLIVLWIMNRVASRAERNLDRLGETFGQRWRQMFGRMGGPPMVSRGPGTLVLIGVFAYGAYLSSKLFESRIPLYICLFLGGLQLLPAVISILQAGAPVARSIRDGAIKLFGRRESNGDGQP